MKTREILTIIAISSLGLFLLCSLVKMSMGDKDSKHYGKACGAFIILFVILLTVSQFLNVSEKYDTTTPDPKAYNLISCMYDSNEQSTRYYDPTKTAAENVKFCTSKDVNNYDKPSVVCSKMNEYGKNNNILGNPEITCDMSKPHPWKSYDNLISGKQITCSNDTLLENSIPADGVAKTGGGIIINNGANSEFVDVNKIVGSKIAIFCRDPTNKCSYTKPTGNLPLCPFGNKLVPKKCPFTGIQQGTDTNTGVCNMVYGAWGCGTQDDVPDDGPSVNIFFTGDTALQQASDKCTYKGKAKYGCTTTKDGSVPKDLPLCNSSNKNTRCCYEDTIAGGTCDSMDNGYWTGQYNWNPLGQTCASSPYGEQHLALADPSCYYDNNPPNCPSSKSRVEICIEDGSKFFCYNNNKCYTHGDPAGWAPGACPSSVWCVAKDKTGCDCSDPADQTCYNNKDNSPSSKVTVENCIEDGSSYFCYNNNTCYKHGDSAGWAPRACPGSANCVAQNKDGCDCSDPNDTSCQTTGQASNATIEKCIEDSSRYFCYNNKTCYNHGDSAGWAPRACPGSANCVAQNKDGCDCSDPKDTSCM